MKRAGVVKTGPPPRLGQDVEDEVVAWIKLAHSTGASIPKTLLRTKVKEIALKLKMDPSTVGGKKWEGLFFARHEDLSVRQAQLIGLERLVSLTRPAIKRFYDILEAASAGVAQNDKWIADETNVELRGGGGKVRQHGRDAGGFHVSALQL